MTAEQSAQLILDRYVPLIEDTMQRALAGRADLLLYQMIRYHLGWSEGPGGPPSAAGKPAVAGKRVRPTLCLLSCEAVGGDVTLALPAAAAVELIHAFTLLHDDIADQDELRRGRPTVWRQWGVGQAITAGDALYALANLCLSLLDADRLPAATIADVHRELNDAVLVVCEGQQLDLSYEGRADITVDGYVKMVMRKTAALFAAGTGLGAQIGGGALETVDALGRFGYHLGLAFQIRDDILGLWGNPAELGKPVGGDLRRNKRSLPVVHALAKADPTGAIAARLAAGVNSDGEAAALASQIDAAGSRAFCEQLASQAMHQALAALGSVALEDAAARDLRALAHHLADRTA